ncbi:hypothetical protein ACFVW1_29300 [Streptomyces olivochromogenes]|uniref:hypothetical protein n=1 Tax=Streptomyces olivochromogenes TaxID=1963 RepID=UPI0036D830C5
MVLRSRRGSDMAPAFPEVVAGAVQLPDATALDGELVVWDAAGRPRAFAARAWWARMRCSVSGSGGGEYTSDLPQLGGGQRGLSGGAGRFLPVWRTGGPDEDVPHPWA